MKHGWPAFSHQHSRDNIFKGGIEEAEKEKKLPKQSSFLVQIFKDTMPYH